jgi:hypothetical protein
MALETFEDSVRDQRSRDWDASLSAMQTGQLCSPENIDRATRRDAIKQREAPLARAFVLACKDDPKLGRKAAAYNLPEALNPASSTLRETCAVK